MRGWMLALVIVAILTAPRGVAAARPLGQAAGVAQGDLTDLLPSEAGVPAGLVVAEEGARTEAEVAAGFLDPAEAGRLLDAWGWAGNAYRNFARQGSTEPGEAASVEVSLHRFGTAAGATAALDYYAEGRKAALGLGDARAEPLGDQARAVGGPVDAGSERTNYVRLGDVLARVSAVGAGGEPTADAAWVARVVAGNGYASPQFGYRVTWGGSWEADPAASVDGSHDHLRLTAVREGLGQEFRGVFTDRGEEAALRAYAEERRELHPGATSRLPPATAGGATDPPLAVFLTYTTAAGVITNEVIGVSPLVRGESVQFRIFTAPADADPGVVELLTEEIALVAGRADGAAGSEAAERADGSTGAGSGPSLAPDELLGRLVDSPFPDDELPIGASSAEVRAVSLADLVSGAVGGVTVRPPDWENWIHYQWGIEYQVFATDADAQRAYEALIRHNEGQGNAVTRLPGLSVHDGPAVLFSVVPGIVLCVAPVGNVLVLGNVINVNDPLVAPGMAIALAHAGVAHLQRLA